MELKETNWGQKSFGNCAGLQNPISSGSNTIQCSPQSKNECRLAIRFSESRNKKYVAERCHSESVTCFRRDFKACVRYFLSNFNFFHQMIALQKLRKMFFISSKTLFPFSRYSNFCNFFPSFSHFPDLKGQMKVE